MKRMTEYQRTLAEHNIALVDEVIRTKMCVTGQVLQSYDDYYAVGCEALCHAAMEYNYEKGDFGPLARRCIYNAMVDHSRMQMKRHTMQLEDGVEADDNAFSIRYLCDPHDSHDVVVAGEIAKRIAQCKDEYAGVAKKGIEVLEMKEAGYTSAEIAEFYGTNINNINAWIARSRRKLGEDSKLAGLLV